MSIYGTRLREEIDRIGVSTLARLMEKSRNTLYNWADKENVPLDQLVALASHGVNVRYVLERVLDDSPLVKEHVAQNFAQDENLVMVPRYNVRASAGHGAWNTAEAVVDRLAFKRDWISQMGLDPLRLALIQIEGGSMDPTLMHEDLILVNLNVVQFVMDGIYVILNDGVLLVKRLQRLMTGHVLIKSDNPAYAPETISPDEVDKLKVVGGVVWFGREL